MIPNVRNADAKGVSKVRFTVFPADRVFMTTRFCHLKVSHGTIRTCLEVTLHCLSLMADSGLSLTFSC